MTHDPSRDTAHEASPIPSRQHAPGLRLRRRGVWAAGALALAVVALAYGRLLAAQGGAAGLDAALWQITDSWSVSLRSWARMSRLGTEVTAMSVAMLGGALVTLDWARRGQWRRGMVLGAACPLLAGAVGLALELGMKPLVGRWWGPALAYPSGHAGGTAAVVAVVVVLARCWPLRSLALVLGVAWSGAVGVAMTAKHSHFPTDILGGWAVGAAAGTLAALTVLTVVELVGRWRARRGARTTLELAA